MSVWTKDEWNLITDLFIEAAKGCSASHDALLDFLEERKPWPVKFLEMFKSESEFSEHLRLTNLFFNKFPEIFVTKWKNDRFLLPVGWRRIVWA